MNRSTSIALAAIPLLLIAIAAGLPGQQPPYDVFPPADPPYYRVRYEAGAQKGDLVFPVNYTVWIPKDVKTLRGVVVHQHGCGDASETRSDSRLRSRSHGHGEQSPGGSRSLSAHAEGLLRGDAI